MQLADIPKFLDALLYTASEESRLGGTLISTHLIQQANCPVSQHDGLFLIDMLLEDGYLRHVIEGYSAVPVVTISAKGVRFIATGGYVGHYSNENEAIKKEQVRLGYEIKHLKTAIWAAYISLALSFASLLAMLFK